MRDDGLEPTENKPLAGRSVVVTRAQEQAGELVAHLSRMGAEVLLLPAVEFVPAEGPELDDALQELQTFDWVLLTSQNAVRFVAGRLREIGAVAEPGDAGKPRFAAVGPATARAAAEAGLRVDHVASRALGDVLARDLAAQMCRKRVLLPRSDRARADLPAALRAAGAAVVEVVAYRTLTAAPGDPGVLQRIERGEVDVISFASPSAFYSLLDALGAPVLRRVVTTTALASLGPVTTAAIREAGLPVAMQADEASAAGLAAALARHFSNPTRTGANV